MPSSRAAAWSGLQDPDRKIKALWVGHLRSSPQDWLAPLIPSVRSGTSTRAGGTTDASLSAAGRQSTRFRRRQSARAHRRRLTNSGGNHVQLTRTLILGAALAAMNLAGMTAVAQAQSNDPDGKQARRQATESQVGETWRKHQATPQQQAATADAVQQFRRGERASQEQTTPGGSPAQVPAPSQAPEPSGQPGWLVPSLAVLVAALAVSGGLAVMAAKRASRRVRAGHA